MFINNPVYTMRLVDLLDMYKDEFTYEDLYKVVGEWLSTEQKYFFTNDNSLWLEFIQAFCDRFYSRNFNFDTTLDFKLKLRDVLKANKNQAIRIFESNAIKINPLNTYSNTLTRNEKYIGISKNSNNSESIINNSNSNENNSTGFNYNLHSDTPSNAVNIDDLFSVAKNYVTDATNIKNNEQTTNKSMSKNETTSNSNSRFDNENNNLFNEISSGYNGNPTELIEKYMQLKTDVIQFYLDKIENACLFSCVLY